MQHVSSINAARTGGVSCDRLEIYQYVRQHFPRSSQAAAYDMIANKAVLCAPQKEGGGVIDSQPEQREQQLR